MAPVGTDAALRRDWVKILAGLEPRHHAEALPHLRAFDRPVLLTWAPGDRIFPIRLAERLSADLPRAELVRLAPGRAFTPLDQPERLASTIRAFVERTADAATAQAV
jgi:pimeloyl-ACP methyl ester carboxylesterase